MINNGEVDGQQTRNTTGCLHRKSQPAPLVARTVVVSVAVVNAAACGRACVLLLLGVLRVAAAPTPTPAPTNGTEPPRARRRILQPRLGTT